MFSKFSLLTILVLVFLEGCDPALCVVISNKSAASKTIRVTYPKIVKRPPGDSLDVYNVIVNSNGNRLRIPIFAKDTVLRTYSFILQPGWDAIVGLHGIGSDGAPFFGQMAIINNKDSVLLVRRNKLLVKHYKFMVTTWKYTISD